MRIRGLLAVVVATVLVSGTSAFAQDHHGEWQRATPEQRMQMMRKIHTGFVLELGQLLDLDTEGTLKLAARLQHFDDQRIQLRLENADAMAQLRHAAHDGTPLPDAAGLARHVAANRVRLAQIDQSEMEEIFKGLPPAKIAKVAVFMAEYPRRIERMARELHHEEWMKHNGPPPPQDDE